MMTLAPIRARWKAVLFPMPGGETREIAGERRYVECTSRVKIKAIADGMTMIIICVVLGECEVPAALNILRCHDKTTG